jgi:hypothetical protein
VLSDEDVRGMEDWVAAAGAWSVAAQSLVGAATGLATQSRDLADQLQAGKLGSSGNGGNGSGRALDSDLRTLADSVETDTEELRNRYLATATELDQYTNLIG